MSRFVQIHLLTAYPPSNLNRDDLGRPKTAIVGGSTRLRISSQSLKRAWRTSDLFEEAVGEFKGERTKRIGVRVYDQLIDEGIKEKSAFEWSSQIASVFGKLEKPKAKPKSVTKKNAADDKETDEEAGTDADNEKGPLISQLAHISPEENQLVMDLTAKLIEENRAPVKDELDLLRKKPKAIDIAMFGRMLADAPSYNVDASVQVAHAFSVNAAMVEDDFFTAVDDLKVSADDAGAGHMGDAGFGSGVFYLYLCIDRTSLVENLQGDETLANRAIEALVHTAAQTGPTGKQNSFASRAYTSYLMAEKGDSQPRSLAVAFYKVKPSADQVGDAIKALIDQSERLDKVYGDCAEARCSFDTNSGTGTLQEVLKFLSE